MKKGFIPSWYVSFGALIISFLLVGGLYVMVHYTQQDAIREVESRHLPSLAAQDLIGILNTETSQGWKLYERIIGAAETGNYRQQSAHVTAAVLNSLRRRGCPDCLWYLRVHINGKEQYVWPEGANPDRLTGVQINIPLEEFERYKEYMMQELMADVEIRVKKDVRGYWLARRRMYLAYQRLPFSGGLIEVEYAAGKEGQVMQP